VLHLRSQQPSIHAIINPQTNMSNFIKKTVMNMGEKQSGHDLDHDGRVGGAGAPGQAPLAGQQQHGQGGGAANKVLGGIESKVGMDLNGDGRVTGH
jgi:hypothetical protein